MLGLRGLKKGISLAPRYFSFTNCMHDALLCTSTQVSLEAAVREKLEKSFKLEYLDVVNESAMHNVPKGSASHFRIVIVSPEFDGKSLVQRHRMVNNILAEELKGPIHALAIQAISSKEKEEAVRTKSPPCKGGHGL